MATNRDKINNMSNKKLGHKVFDVINKIQIQGKPMIYSSVELCDSFIAWLSQEAEEDTVHIPQIGNIPKIDRKVEMTEQAYNDILARLDKLEEFTKIQMDDFWKDHYKATYNIQLSGYSYGTVETKTADQMFEELNYSKEDTNSEWIRYCKLSEDDDYDCDSIKINKKTYLYYKESVREKFNERRACGITEAEDKAIHKKIEELKHA